VAPPNFRYLLLSLDMNETTAYTNSIPPLGHGSRTEKTQDYNSNIIRF